MGGAPTLLETAMEARRRRGDSTPSDGGQEQREQSRDTSKQQDQFTIKERNPDAEDRTGGQNISKGRRVQQDPNNPTDEEKTLSFVHDRLFPGRKKKGEGEGEQKGEGQQQQQKKEEKKVDVKKQEAPKPISPEDVARISASAATTAALEVARQMGGKQEKKDEGQEDDDIKSMSEDDRYNFDVVTHMAESAPDKYKELPRKFREAMKMKKAYADRWLAENPGKEIDWDAEEHAQFLEDNQPKVNDRDFRRAEISIEASKIADERMKGTQAEIDTIERDSIQSNIGATAKQRVTAAQKDFQNTFAPDADWDLTTPEGRAKVLEEEQVIGEVAVKWAELLGEATTELVKIFDGRSARTGRNLFKIDENNDLHKWIMTTVDHFEDKLTQMPADKTRNNLGQAFATRDQYNSMPADQRKKFWTVKRDEALWIVSQSAKENAEYEKQQAVKKVEAIAKQHGWRFNPDSIVTQRRKRTQVNDGIDSAGEGADPTGFGRGEDLPPSGGGGGKVDTLQEELKGENKEWVGMMMQRLFQRNKD